MHQETFSTFAPSRLLLVSDRASERTAELTRRLASTGFEVDACAPAEATERASSSAYGLYLLDLEASADAACRALRTTEAARTAPIVVLVEGDDDAQLQAAREAGATDFLEREGAGEALLEHRLRSALRLVEALVRLEELGGRGAAGPRPGAKGGTGFLSRVAAAIDQARDSDRKVAVLELLYDERGGAGQPDVLAALREAVDDMSECGVPAHMRGELRAARLDDGRNVLLVTDLARLQDALKLSRWVQSTIEGAVPGPAPTVGIAAAPENGTDPAQLLERAHEAARSASGQGGNGVSFHDPAMNRWALERITLEASLRNAVERGELVVYYQPKLELASGRVTGFEALVRWKHPELGMVSPGQFIPLAEETGLIVPIGEWVLGTAARQNKAWQDAGFQPVRMAVNLSPLQFRQSGLVEVVGRVLRETGLSPEWLELELTESMLMDDVRKTTQTLRRLKSSGIQLSIDDFGTGYSSLSYLKRFPIDALKIDQSFVREVTTNADDAAIATSILLMGHSLKLKVIAEGVETESQRSFLEVLQCDEIQGFLLSPPVPAGDAEQFLAR